jgi:hypothetical protein
MGGGSGVIENNEKAELNARNWTSFIIGCHPQLADTDMDHVTLDC